MKVNVEGYGIIPGTGGAVAPLMGFDASESFVRRMAIHPKWRIYDAETGLRITEKNVNRFFNNDGTGGTTTPLNWEFLDE